MKKIFVISDIHGSLDDLEKALIIYNKERKSYDKLIILGDILYHGPRNDLPNSYNPKGCISLLNDLKDEIIAINGNCDAEVDQMVLKFKLFKQKDLKINNKTIHLEHGHKLLKNKKNYDIILTGHTHIAVLEKNQEENFILGNPGSISIPKENSPKCYIELTNESISLINLENNEVLKSIKLN